MEIQKKAARSEKSVNARRAFVRYGSIAAALVLVCGSILGIALKNGSKGSSEAAPQMAAAADSAVVSGDTAGNTQGSQAVRTAAAPETLDSYDALYELITKMDQYYGNDGATTEMALGAAPEAAAEEAGTDSSASMTSGSADRNEAAVTEAPMGDAAVDGDYSTTNVQVAGIDEADVLKTDGEYIYYLSGEQLVILRAGGKDTSIVSATRYLDNDEGWWGYASELFLLGDRLMIMTQKRELIFSETARDGFDAGPQTLSLVYDISDRAKPKLVSTLGQSGYYVSSRLVGDYVYLVTSQRVYSVLRDEPRSFVPEIAANGSASTLAIDNIYLYENANTPVYTVISSFNLKDGKEQSASRAALGGASDIYCNGPQLLVAAGDYHEDVSPIAPDKDGKNVQVTSSYSNTRLMLFTLSDGAITRSASGTVRGTLLNQFAMDAYKNVFRIVTTVNEWTQRIYTDGVDTYEYEDKTTNCLYTLDQSLNQLGALEGLAEDEWVESVRFDGDIAYFVTFRQVDPLFTVDLTNPAKPKLLSTLKIPGFSEYLHVFAEGRLLGIGYDADEKTGRMENVKLSMFNTAKKSDVKELFTLSVNANWTTAGSNHKSILVDANKNLIAFPADGSYYIYSYSDEKGFSERAVVRLSGNVYSDEIRGLFIKDCFYVISSSGLEVLSLADFTSLTTLKFN